MVGEPQLFQTCLPVGVGHRTLWGEGMGAPEVAPAKERTHVPEDAFLWELPSGAAENTGGGAVKRGNMKK